MEGVATVEKQSVARKHKHRAINKSKEVPRLCSNSSTIRTPITIVIHGIFICEKFLCSSFGRRTSPRSLLWKYLDVEDLFMFRSSESHRLTGSHMLIPFDWLIDACHRLTDGRWKGEQRRVLRPCGLLRGFSRALRAGSLRSTKKLQLVHNSHEAQFCGASGRVTLTTRPACNLSESRYIKLHRN